MSETRLSADSEPATREYVLRAMARNYKPGNSWDKLDAEACIQAADEIKALREWKNAILSKCKASDGFDTLHWGGDKDGWGFVHYFIGHLETRALSGAVAQPEQEPVAWRWKVSPMQLNWQYSDAPPAKFPVYNLELLYAAQLPAAPVMQDSIEAIISGIGAADAPAEQALEIVHKLGRAGYAIVKYGDVAAVETVVTVEACEKCKNTGWCIGSDCCEITGRPPVRSPLSRSSAGNDDLAARAAELLTVPMGWGSGPALKALAEKIGGPYAEVGARNQTVREALEAVVRMGGGPQPTRETGK